MTVLYGNNVDSKVAQDCKSAPRDYRQAAEWRIDANARAFYQAMQNARYHERFKRLNIDSADFGARAYHLAKELEFVYGEVLRTQYAANNAFELWKIDSRPGAGAKYHTVQRLSHKGVARYYRGNASDRGNVDAEKTEKSFPIHPIVTSIQFDFFETLASGFANSGLQEELSIAAYQAIRDFKNDKTFEGDDEMGIRGILNYPWTPKTPALVPFTTAEDPDAILAELHRLANNAAEVSKQVHQPNRMITGVRKHHVLTTTKRSATTDQTILQAFLEDNPYIQSVVAVHEFDDAGPNGTDVIFFDRANDLRSVANVIPAGFSMLPMQQTGFDFEIPCYMLDGGVIQRDPLNNLIAYVE